MLEESHGRPAMSAPVPPNRPAAPIAATASISRVMIVRSRGELFGAPAIRSASMVSVASTPRMIEKMARIEGTVRILRRSRRDAGGASSVNAPPWRRLASIHARMSVQF